ncbi:MAG TPA: lamin tail domain-containing protein [bacterium]|nr:lamin tail domain-containing protein [bacterium]
MNRSNLRYLSIGAIVLAVALVPLRKTLAQELPKGYFSDKEDSTNNTLTTTTLDLELTSTKSNFDPANNLYLGESSNRDITIKNVGYSAFVYSLEIVNIPDRQKEFCKKLELKIEKGNSSEIYKGKLEETTINTNGTNEDMILKNTEDAHNYSLKVTVPEKAEEILSDGVCSFDIRVVGWLGSLPYKTAFWDKESLSNTVATKEWLIKMGYETAETLKDENDGNPNLGFCNVVTGDKSQNGGKSALQILKWSKIQGANEYRITGYKQNEGDSWSQYGASYNPGDYPKRLSCGENICVYTTWASNKGKYAYFIEALDSNKKIIGKTIPETQGFDCTYTVDWPNTGSVIINEIMWAGSSTIQQDFWVELLNTTNKDIDLTGWILEGIGESDYSIKLSGTIPANGYYLVAHYKTDYTAENNAAIKDSITADLVDNNLLLRPHGEQLTLKAYTGDTIDQTPQASGEDAWTAGLQDNHNKSYQSMQRKETPGDGTDKNNWITCAFNGCKSSNYWDNDLTNNYGTPKSANIYEN